VVDVARLEPDTAARPPQATTFATRNVASARSGSSSSCARIPSSIPAVAVGGRVAVPIDLV
jgi:hypothetical protein